MLSTDLTKKKKPMQTITSQKHMVLARKMFLKDADSAKHSLETMQFV